MKLLQILILVSVVNADQFFNNFTICGKPIKKRTMESSNYVSPGYFPWQAAVKKTVISNFNGLPDCGATLISNEWLVSAAHCNITVGDHVVLGANYIGLSVEESRQYFRVKFVRPHPSYSKVTNDYDIALVQLDKPATYTDYVRPACIINSGTKLAAATKSEVSGWGLLKCGGPENLQKGEISISSNDVCNQIYGNKEVTPRMLCAKHPAGGREGCLGDGGGPLVVDVKQNQQFYLAGVVSWGTKCRHGFPEVFANVSTLREWLQEELKSKKVYPIESDQVPLYRYYDSNFYDHFYTTHWVKFTPEWKGWKYDDVQCKILKSQSDGSVPLYRYYHATNVNHFYTTNITEIGTAIPGRVGNDGFVSQGITGYCYPVQKTGTIPLYHYYNKLVKDSLYTTSANEIGNTEPCQIKKGYTYIGITCYVFPN